MLVTVRLPAMRFQLGLSLLHVAYAKRDVVHYTSRVQIGIGLDVEHVLHPVSAVGDLHRYPVSFFGLHSTVPINVKAENVAIEMVFSITIVHVKSDVNYA